MTQAGHNSDLTEGERKALFFHHLNTIQAQTAVVDKANEEKKRLRKLAKADGIILSDIDFAQKALEIEDNSILPERLRRETEIAQWLNLPVLYQPDLFEVEDRAPAMDRIREDGRVAGLNGRNAESGYAEGSDEDTIWLGGWEEGQQVLRDDLESAMEKKNAAKQQVENEAEQDDPFPEVAE